MNMTLNDYPKLQIYKTREKMKKLQLLGTLLMGSNILFAGGDVLTPVEPVTDLPETTIEDTSSRLYNVGLKVGTLGVGVDVSTPINNSFALRVNINGATYSHSASEEDIDYDADLKFANAGVLVDYFPFESVGFHLSAGAYYNANKIEAQGQPTAGTFTIDDMDYQASEIGSLDAKLDFDKFAPYVGLGWGNDSRSEGFGFSLDLGMLVGKTNTYLTATRGIVDDATWADIQNSVANEKEKLDDNLDELKVYPVISVGITYTF